MTDKKEKIAITGFVPFFFKTRAKTARVITFEEFNQALHELAPKRFKGKGQAEAIQHMYGLVAGQDPANAGVTVSISRSYQSLLQHSHG